jgi:hypothetical protein
MKLDIDLAFCTNVSLKAAEDTPESILLLQTSITSSPRNPHHV